MWSRRAAQLQHEHAHRGDARTRATERPRDSPPWLGPLARGPAAPPPAAHLAPQTLTDGHTDGHRRPDTAGRTLDAHRETPLPYSATRQQRPDSELSTYDATREYIYLSSIEIDVVCFRTHM